MSGNGKISLVVLRSWSDGPPKIRAIAPPDDDRAIYVPDHHGRFVTEEMKEDPRLAVRGGVENPPPRCASSASQYKEVQPKDGSNSHLTSVLPMASYKKTVDGVVYRKSPLQRCFAIANPGGVGSTSRHSYSGVGASSAGLVGSTPGKKGLSPLIQLSLPGVDSFGKEIGYSSRPESAASPDNPDASSLEYSPPASPVNGRYRNLGPELAATIPKRTVRNSWIAEVKQRWNNKSTSGSGSNSGNTAHPSSRLSSRHSAGGVVKRASGGSSLKSYSSSPSLIYRNDRGKTKGVGKNSSASEEDDDEEEEDGDYFLNEGFTLRRGNGETPQHHRRSSLQRIHLGEEEREQQPFFNPLYKFGHNRNSNINSSSGISVGGTNDSFSGSSSSPSGNDSSFSSLRNNLKSVTELEGTGTRSNSSISNGDSLVHRHRSNSGTALSVDDDSQSDRSRSSLGYPPSNNSGNTSYSPSPPLTSNTPHDHIYTSLTEIHELHSNKKGGRLDPFKLGESTGSSDVVLVEVIRKQVRGPDTGTNNENINSSLIGDKYKSEKFGSVDLIQKVGSIPTDEPQTKVGKRHSVEVVESIGSGNKTSGGKVEGSPGKVQRLKESLKRFGRFGRSNTDKIVRAHSDSGFSTDDIHGGDIPSSTGRIKRQSEGDKSNIYENPSEIIVTSLKDTESIGITVKPAARKRSKQSETLSASPENIYAVLNDNNRDIDNISIGNSEKSSRKFQEKASNNNDKDDETPQLSLSDSDDNNLTEGQSESPATTVVTEIATVDNTSDRISPISLTSKSRRHELDEEDDDEHIPHLEFDKGENENSTSHDESCSSRAESLTYSSTSHEQDRSMPQQIVQIVHQKQLISKVDTLSSEDSAATSIASNSSETLNCEVTPVIPKRNIEGAREPDQAKASGSGPPSLNKDCHSEASACLIKNNHNKQPVATQISSSFNESSNQNNHCDEGTSLLKKENDEAEKVAGVLQSSGITNKEFEFQNRGEQDQQIQTSSSLPTCITPVTLNESSDTIVESDVGGGGVNMNSLSRICSKPTSREISNGQQQQKQNIKGFYNDDNVNGTEGPEIMASKAEHGGDGEERNGMGKHENGTASVQVPVQAVNRHVLGYGVSSANSVSSDNPSEDQYNASIASTISKNDSEWNRSSLRASLKGFCNDMLHQDKIAVPVPDVVEAVLNFDEDCSSIEQDDERENSIEYISVANVKVNREKKVEKIHPRDELPSCVIALDLGSRGSGYAYWIKEESEFVRIGNVDGGSSCPASHKAPSWVMFDDLYLDGDEDEETSQSIRPGFGFQALDKYLTDDAHGQLSWRWREHFHEAKSFPYTLESKASDDDLIFMMKSAIRHYGRQAMEQISQRKKGARGPMVIIIAIPSTFDQRARQLVREAASEAGILSESDSIALIEDSCATGLYSLHALKSKLNKESSSKEMSYLSVDCGAAYVHFSGYQVIEGKLRQLVLSRSEPLIDGPESLFEAELSAVFTPNYIFNYQNKHKAGWLKLMTEFEHAKNRFDSLSKQNYYVFVPSSFVDHFRRFTNMEMEDALESSDMVWNKTGALGIPHWKMQRFLQPLLDYVNDKIVTSLKKHKFEHLILTGGRAGAKFYVDSIRATAKGFGATLHVPKEHNAAVLQGSTISLTNLAPRLVIRSRFSIGVGVMTPFSEENHPEEKRVMRDGKSWCADVWDSLIKADQELELNRVIIKRSYVGAQPGQSLLVLPLFKSPDEPKFVTESSVKKCCELKFTSGQRAWQEVELVLVCRPSEILIKAMDGGVMKSYVVVDFSD